MKKELIVTACLIIALVAGLLIGLRWGSMERREIKRENEILREAWDALHTDHEALLLEYEALNTEYNTLNETYRWLKDHSFTYYVEGNAINISNVAIIEGWLGDTINGTMTNISNEPLETVYIYLILRNPDGTADFDPYKFDTIESLYIDESATFEFYSVFIDETQTVEFLLIY